jgi:hypothetical protein
MPLHHIRPEELPRVWPQAAPLLQKGIDTDPRNPTIEQVEWLVRTGKLFLLVWEEPGEGVTGAVTVEFIDYPRERVAQVDFLGGKGVVRGHVFEAAQQWMRLYGATKAQCWCQPQLVPMYEKMGLKNTHHVMRMDL